MRAFRFVARSALCASALTPTIIYPGFIFPFVEPKAIFFRTAVIIAAAAWLASCVEERRWPERLGAPVLWLLGVLIVLAVSNLLAPFPPLAFLSRPERAEGYVYLAHLLAFVVVGACVFDTERSRRVLLHCMVIGSVMVAISGLGHYRTVVLMGRPDMQIYSTLGNPVFLGQFAVLAACLSALLFVRASRLGRAWLGTAFALNFVMVFLSQGRGAALATIAALFVGATALADQRARMRGLTYAILAATILVAVPALVTDLPREAARRFTEIDLSDPRLAIWSMAWEAVKVRPLFGWGQDGMLFSVGQIIPADRAHNLILDWLVVGGVVGLVAWLGFVGSLWRGAVRFFGEGERAALHAFLTAYLVTNMVLFDTLSTYILLGTVGIIVASRWAEQPVAARAAISAPIAA